MNEQLQNVAVESSTLAILNKSEIDQQVATAHQYPRSIKRFRDESLFMVTLNENVAQECIYALPRGNKTIEGPSARFAEVIASAWGNNRAGARVVSDQGDFVTAQGVFHDLERNVAITYEVQRRITNKQGKRYDADMIGVTANAACSIALRNAILKGVPKAFWSDMYEEARRTAIGDAQTLASRRARALSKLQKYGVAPAKVFTYLDIAGEEDMTADHLTVLFGIMTAIKEGDTTAEQAFGERSKEIASSSSISELANMWIKSLDEVTDWEQLDSFWRRGATQLSEASDLTGYKAFKAAVEAKNKSFKPQGEAATPTTTQTSFIEAEEADEGSAS